MTDTLAIADAIAEAFNGIPVVYDTDIVATEAHHFWTLPLPRAAGRGMFVSLYQIGQMPPTLVLEERTELGGGEPIPGKPCLTVSDVTPTLAGAVVALMVIGAIGGY